MFEITFISCTSNGKFFVCELHGITKVKLEKNKKKKCWKSDARTHENNNNVDDPHILIIPSVKSKYVINDKTKFNFENGISSCKLVG